MEKHIKTRYSVQEAFQLIIEPGEDSELSELDKSDDENVEIPDEILEEVIPGDDGNDQDQVEVPEENQGGKKAKSTRRKSEKKEEHIFKWCKKEPPKIGTTFTGGRFSQPPDDVDDMTPLRYFKLFWGDDLTSLLSEQTNLYSVQKSGKSINTTKDEIEKLLGLQMYTSIIKMPSYALYWAAETRYAPVADIMSINRYKKLRQYLHVSNNTFAKNDENKGNRLYKIQPVLDHVRDNCLKIEPEIENSIDQQIIPAKTKYSGIRQYNPKKPVKWGFKNFVRAGKSDMMYDFFLYAGASTTSEKCTGEYVVLRLSEALPKNQNFKLFFDNWFFTLALCIKLKKMGMLTTATLRVDRLKGCPVPKDKDLMKEGRGSSSYRCDTNSGITVLKWYDNKCVQMCSTYSSPSEISTVSRWDRVQKKYVVIDCPNTIKEYNGSMGGVDLADMLISLYRTNIKTRRWYLKVLFHCVDISKVNAWLLYRRHCHQMNVSKKQQLSLLKFTSAIAHGLANAAKVPHVGRPGKRRASDTPSSVPRKQPAPVPYDDSRYDNVAHWPEFRKKKNKCRLCKVNFSRVYCKKCNLCVCLNSNRNCYYDFHTK